MHIRDKTCIQKVRVAQRKWPPWKLWFRWRIILKLILRTRFISIRVGSVNMVQDFGFHKKQGISYLDEQLCSFFWWPMLHGVSSLTQFKATILIAKAELCAEGIHILVKSQFNFILPIQWQNLLIQWQKLQYHLNVSFILLVAEYVDATPRSSQLL
jgi:hypothetical protein